MSQAGMLSSRDNLYNSSGEVTFITSTEAMQKHHVLQWTVTIKRK